MMGWAAVFFVDTILSSRIMIPKFILSPICKEISNWQGSTLFFNMSCHVIKYVLIKKLNKNGELLNFQNVDAFEW